VELHGRPLSFYTDKAGLFQAAPKIARDLKELSRDERQPLPPTQIGRALAELGIVWIGAHSPQAKGRVERSFQTAQSFTTVNSPPKAKPPEGTPQGPVDRGLAAVYSGAYSVASALNLPQKRDPLENHPHSKLSFSSQPSKPDISTLPGLGHFYFALTYHTEAENSNPPCPRKSRGI